MDDTPQHTPQLTLTDFTRAQAKVPTATWGTLTQQQRTFVAALVQDPTRSYTEAARLAGSKRRQTGSEWARLPTVRAALAAIRAASEDQVENDLAFVTRRLRENDTLAFTEGDVPASNGALGLFAKVRGLTEKRVRISFDDPEVALAQLKALPKAERVRVIRDMLGDT